MEKKNDLTWFDQHITNSAPTGRATTKEPSMDIAAVFKSLPHVSEIWITEDGHHHLDASQGGMKYSRQEVLINK